MATEVGSDIALIQDEDMLRKMWQQTEDFGKKKEIRMRMYKLREQRLKEFYTTGEMIQTETTTTTSKRSSTRTHTESITDQGFMTMKSKEIRDSESPTEDYHRQSNTNKNYYVSSKIDEADGNSRGTTTDRTELIGSVKPNEETTYSALQTSVQSDVAASKRQSSHTTVSVSEEVQKSDVNSSSKMIANEQKVDNHQLTYDTSLNKHNSANASDIDVTESTTVINVDNIKREDIGHYSNGHQKVTETYTSNTTNGDLFERASSDNSVSNKNSVHVDNTYISDVSTNKSENVEIATDSKIINELHKLDSYSDTQQITADTPTKTNSTASNEEKLIVKRVDDQTTDSSKENTEGQYTTTYQHSYQAPRISVDLSPSHEAFARSLRSTPERSSPSPGRERMSPERRLKSVSPEKYRAGSAENGYPPSSVKYSTRRKLSTTHTKDLSKKRAKTPTRGEKYDSSDDSDCSGATHGTYDKYKGFEAKRSLFKEETKITSTSKYNQKSPSTSPVRREKSPGYSSEGSVGKEVRKSKTRNSSHESSPERSAFKPIRNYRSPQTQLGARDDKKSLITEEQDVCVNNYKSKNNCIKVIKTESESDLNKNEFTDSDTQNAVNNIRDLKSNSIQERFIAEEQVYTASSEQVDNVKITKDENRTNREKSPSKVIEKENKLDQEKFIENEKLSSVVKENKKVISTPPKEKSPVKEVRKPVAKDTETYPRDKSPEKILQSSKSKTDTPTKKTTSAIPSSIKKPVPSGLEKTPSTKSLIRKDTKENVTHKTVKKDLSREKVDVKITRNDSKTLVHKNSKESVIPKTVVKRPSQELLKDKKPITSYKKSQLNDADTKPKTQDQITKVIEKKDSTDKFKPSISPQSSRNKLRVVKTSTETKTIADSKRNTENTNSKKIPSTSVTKPKIFASTKTNANETPFKGTKTYSKPTTSFTAKSQIKKATSSSVNKTVKVDVTKNIEPKTKDLEDVLPPDNFESDTDLDDSTEKPTYVKRNSSSSSSSSDSSSEDEDQDEEGKQKIKDLDNTRIEAEEEYGKKMTNKDALLNVIVQLPQSSRESSPEYSSRFGQPYCSVSDDASLPRYADVVSEPEDVNDYRLHSNRYDIVTDLDEDSKTTVADRVSKFLNNANKQEEIKTTEIPQSPRAVKKAKQMFESIAKGQVEESGIDNGHGVGDNENEDGTKESTLINTTEVHDSSKNITTKSSLLTRKISGASDYKTRKEFFENKKSNASSEKVKSSTPSNITRSSSINDRRASFETNADKKTPLKDKTNVVPRTRSPESKNSSPDRTNKSPTKVVKTEVFDVKVEEINKSRRLSGSKTVKDRTATFEKNEIAQKPIKESKTRQPTPTSSTVNTGRISDTYTKSVTASNTKTSDRVPTNRVTSPVRKIKITESTTAVNSSNKSSENVSRKSPDRKITGSPERITTEKSPERTTAVKDSSVNRRVNDTSSRQRITTTTTAKTEFGVTAKSTHAPKTTPTTIRSTSVNDDEVQIEEIFDLHVLETMLEKAVGYDRRRRIRAQIRVVKRQLETKSGKETNITTRVLKSAPRADSPVKSQKQQSNVTVEKTSEHVKKTEIVKKQRSPSPRKPYENPVSDSRSASPQKTLRSVEETRSPLPQRTVRPAEKDRSPSPQKSTQIEKKARSPSPKKTSVVKQRQQQEWRTEKSSRNSTVTSASTTVTTTTKVKSEQASTSVFQEQNVTDLITSSYGVGPTDDNGRPLFGLRALRKTNTNQTITVDDSRQVTVSSQDAVTPALVTGDHGSSKPLFGLKALKSDDEPSTRSSGVHRTKVSEQKGGVDQLITDHKGKPLFGLRALQSIGKTEDELPVYEDMPEPPVSPKLKELVLKHEEHAKESSKLETQPRQKPKAKFRDSFILDTKDEGLYSAFEENGFTEPCNSVTLRSIIKNPEDDQNNETIIKSKSQSTIFQSKSVMRSDGSGNVSVTQDFLKGEVSSVNDQTPSGKLTRGHYTYQSPDDSDAKKGVAKVTTVTTAIGKDTAVPEITEIAEDLNGSDRIDGDNKTVKRTRTNDKFESIQKRFSQESFDRDGSRRSSKETNGYEKPEESPRSTPRSSLVRGDSIKALQHKFQQATVSSSLKQNRSVKSDDSSSNSARRAEEKTVTAKSDTSKNSGATSFLDNNSRVTGVQDVLTRMRNADLVVETGDTTEDIEARALLNKFLGASVILHGMEQGGSKSPISSPATTTTSSASLVNQVEKQRAQKSPVTKKTANEIEDLDNIWDKKQLQILLESCPDYEQRRKIRARLRQTMAEHKACADVVALANTDGTSNDETTHGELTKPVCSLSLKPNATATAVDDSGTESGEEVNQKILVQARGALANLETALPALDPLKRSSVVDLLAKLQASLKPSAVAVDGRPTPLPRKCWNKKAAAAAARQDRHTVGVSSEELRDARRWLEENDYVGGVQLSMPAVAAAAAATSSERGTPRGYDATTVPPSQAVASKTFRPVKFVPPPPKRAHCVEGYVPEPTRHSSHNESFACPPLQHAVSDNVGGGGKSCKSNGRDDSSESSCTSCSSAGNGPSDYDYDDDDDDDDRSVSSARRLLQFAASNNNNNNNGRKYRHGRRAKLLRRAGPDGGERSSEDEHGRRRGAPQPPPASTAAGVPPFEPKTASDNKYLALLRQAREDETSSSNPLNGKLLGNWGNRFGRIKTTFERGSAAVFADKNKPKKNAAKTFWNDICKCPSEDGIAYNNNNNRSKKATASFCKPAGWSAAGGNGGFSHAVRSAFKPVQQQQQPPQRPPPPKTAAFLEPPKTATRPAAVHPQHPRPVHLPLYNSSVATAHRPFIYPSPTSPCSASDLTTTTTSRSASPYSTTDLDAPPPPPPALPQTATVSRVMGSPQTASIVKAKTAHRRYPAAAAAPVAAPSAPVAQAPRPPPRSPRLVPQQRSPASSPVRMPSVLQKSNSWHQIIMSQSKAAARTPLSSAAASGRPLAAVPYEGHQQQPRAEDRVAAWKQDAVRKHLSRPAGGSAAAAVERPAKCATCRSGEKPAVVTKFLNGKEDTVGSRYKEAATGRDEIDDDIDRVEDTFENLFKEATRRDRK